MEIGANPRHAAAHPDHPSTVAAREDLLLAQLYDGLSAYALGPGRAARLAQLIPAEADAEQALTDARATGIRTRLKQIGVSQDSLILELATLPTDPADAAAMAMRARIRTHYGDLHDEHEKLTRQLAALTQQAPPTQDPAPPPPHPRPRPDRPAPRTHHPPGEPAPGHSGWAHRRVRRSDPVEPGHEPGHLQRHHHRHHPQHRRRPP